MGLILLPVLFLLMWLMVIRPQQQRVRRQQALVSSLRIGDEVVTAGGLYGTVVALDDTSASLEVSPGVNVRFLRGAITQRAGGDEADDEIDLDELDDEPAAEDAAHRDGED